MMVFLLLKKMLLADSLVEASFNEDGSFTIKKVAYPKEDPEGGVDFPAFFNEIHVAPDGYVLYGVFSFGSQDVSHKDTLNITNVFLDSDLISPID